MHAVVYELGLIVVINDRYTCWQCLVDLRYLFLDPLDYLLRVFIDSLQDNARDHFSLTILIHRSLPNLVADLHPGNIANANRSAVARVEHDVSDICDVFDQPQAANDVLLVTMLDEVGPSVLIIVLDGIKESFKSDV